MDIFVEAIKQKNLELLQTLITDMTIDINAKVDNWSGNRIIHLVTSPLTVDSNILKLLLTREDLDVNIRNDFGEFPILNLLFDRPNFLMLLHHPTIDVNIATTSGVSLLEMVMRKSSDDMLKDLLHHPNLIINTVYQNIVRHPLIYAYDREDKELEELVKNHPNFDINAVPSEGIRPFLSELIIQKKCEYAERILKEFPTIDVNKRDIHDSAPIVFAIGLNVEFTEILFNHPDIEIDIPDINGYTPIMIAAFHGLRKSFHLLLRYNPDLTIESYTGKNILDVANNPHERVKESTQLNIIQTLLEYMKKRNIELCVH